MNNFARDFGLAIFTVLALAALGNAGGCERGCSPGVQDGQGNPIAGDRPGVCKTK